jgi:hypothetical protein
VRLRVDDRVDELGHGAVEVREAIKQSSISMLVNNWQPTIQSPIRCRRHRREGAGKQRRRSWWWWSNLLDVSKKIWDGDFWAYGSGRHCDRQKE